MKEDKAHRRAQEIEKLPKNVNLVDPDNKKGPSLKMKF
jgi:hypothetical protein